MIAIQKIEVGHTYEVGKHGVDRIDICEDGRIAVHRNGTIVYFVAVEGQTRLQEQVTYGANRVDHPWAKIPNDSTVKGQLAYSESLYPEHVRLREAQLEVHQLDKFARWMCAALGASPSGKNAVVRGGPWRLSKCVWEYLAIDPDVLNIERKEMADRGHMFDMTPPRQP